MHFYPHSIESIQICSDLLKFTQLSSTPLNPPQTHSGVLKCFNSTQKWSNSLNEFKSTQINHSIVAIGKSPNCNHAMADSRAFSLVVHGVTISILCASLTHSWNIKKHITIFTQENAEFHQNLSDSTFSVLTMYRWIELNLPLRFDVVTQNWNILQCHIACIHSQKFA